MKIMPDTEATWRLSLHQNINTNMLYKAKKWGQR